MNSAKALVKFALIEYTRASDSNCAPLADGRLHLESRPKHASSFRCTCRLIGRLFHREFDSVEMPAASENFLCGINVHHRQVASERTGQALPIS